MVDSRFLNLNLLWHLHSLNFEPETCMVYPATSEEKGSKVQSEGSACIGGVDSQDKPT
jgi:hypothetical protein